MSTDLHRKLSINRIRELIRIHQRKIFGICRSDVHIALGELDHRNAQNSSKDHVRIIAGQRCHGDFVFDFGPVGRKLSQLIESSGTKIWNDQSSDCQSYMWGQVAHCYGKAQGASPTQAKCFSI
jgi:hypothetical protein